MQKSMFRKGLVCLVIILFIGISIAPSVTSIEFSKDNTSNDNDLVEITLQLCKTDGVEDHKMFITQEQDERLDRLIESFKADLDNAETRDETNEIYKDMVVSLDKLGILPENTNCKEVQELVAGDSYGFNKVKDFVEHKKPILINLLAEKYKERKGTSEELENYLCLITGISTHTFFIGPIGAIIGKTQEFLIDLGLRLLDDYFDIAMTIIFIAFLLAFPLILSVSIWTIIPFLFGASVIFGYNVCDITGIPPNPYYVNSEGWIYTLGLLGKKDWVGPFWGNISVIDLWEYIGFVGATGFTGMKISLLGFGFYLGSALRVKLGPNYP